MQVDKDERIRHARKQQQQQIRTDRDNVSVERVNQDEIIRYVAERWDDGDNKRDAG